MDCQLAALLGLAHPELLLPPASAHHTAHPALQDLPESLSAEEAQGPACIALVGDMCQLFDQLKALSHLDDAGDQQVGPGCARVAWLSGCWGVQAGRCGFWTLLASQLPSPGQAGRRRAAPLCL